MGSTMDDTIVYQNVIVGEGRAAPDGGSTFEGVLAQVDAQRGGTIISDGLAYYASLQRLVLSTRLPTLIAELAVPTSLPRSTNSQWWSPPAAQHTQSPRRCGYHAARPPS